MYEEAVLAAVSTMVIGVALILDDKKKKKRRNRTIWVQEWIKQREEHGAYHALVNELSLSAREDYRSFMRMNTETFTELIDKIRPYISKQTTVMRKPISAEEKLALTLRFLATGESFESLAFSFRIHNSTVAKFVPVVCHYIYHLLKDEYLKLPSTEDEWRDLADKNFASWQFPNSIAAADGKHIAIKKPGNAGSEYWNYKGHHSIVLMALVTYDYRFLYADVGCQGRISDGGVWANCDFSKKFNQGEIKFPEPRPLPKPTDPAWKYSYTDIDLPFVIVGDNAFPLREHIMKPYPEKKLDDKSRIFNYRLSRFRRVSENCFGILINRFRVFCNRIDLHPDIVVMVTRAAIVLHNMLLTKSRNSYTPPGYADEISTDQTVTEGEWRREEIESIFSPCCPRNRANRPKLDACKVRDTYAQYFYGPGQVPWQWKSLL